MDPYPPPPPGPSSSGSHSQSQQGPSPAPVRRAIRTGPSSSSSGPSAVTAGASTGLPPIHQLHPFLANSQQSYHAAQMQYYHQQPQHPQQGMVHGPPPTHHHPGPPDGHHSHHPHQVQQHQQQQQQQQQDYLDGDSEEDIGESSAGGQGTGPGATSPLSGEPVKKKRRRQALSCTECKRRKIRCDRQHPCGPCARRNEHEKCKWHVIEPVEKFVTRTEYDALKSTLGRLESMVSGMASSSPVNGAPGSSLAHSAAGFPAPITVPAGTGAIAAANASSLPTRFPPPPQVLNAPSSASNVHLQPPLSAQPKRKQDRVVAILSRVLPRKEVCDRLVTYYFRSLSSHHAVIHQKAFQHAYDLFWFHNPLSTTEPSTTSASSSLTPTRTGPGPGFVALLLVILCLALESVGPEEAIKSAFVLIPPRQSGPSGTSGSGAGEPSPSATTFTTPSPTPSDIVMDTAEGDEDGAPQPAASRRTQAEMEMEKERRRRDRVGKREWGKLCVALWKGSKSVLGLTSSLGGAGGQGTVASGVENDDLGTTGGSPLDLALAGTAGTSVGLDVMQCLVLYSYCNQNLEQRGYEAQAPTLALAIRVAYGMGLARLPPDKPYHIPEPGVLKREISRRLFYTLLALDWHLSPSLGHTYLMHPSQFSVEEPLNLNFEELLEGKSLEPKGSGVYTGVSGLLARIKVARRVKALTDKHNSPEGVRYELLLEHEAAIQEDAATLPKCLWSMDAELENSNPEVKWDRLNYTFAKHARTIRLHRPYVILGYRDARHRHSSEASVAAAEATLNAYDEAKSAGMPGASYWMVNKYCFAAVVVLLIDQYYVDRVDGPNHILLESRKRKIRNAVQLLRDISDISTFSRRAALLIDHLLVEIDSPRYREAMTQQQIGQKRPSSPTPGASSREAKRARGEDAASRASSQHATPPAQQQPQHATLSLLSSSLPTGVYLNSAHHIALAISATITSSTTAWKAGEDYLDAWISATGVEIPKAKPLTGLSGTSTPMIMGDLEDGFWRRVFDLDFEAPKDSAGQGPASSAPTNVAPFAPVLGQVTSAPSPWLSGAGASAAGTVASDHGGASSSGSMGWTGPAAAVVHPMSEPSSWKTTAAALEEDDGDDY